MKSPLFDIFGHFSVLFGPFYALFFSPGECALFDLGKCALILTNVSKITWQMCHFPGKFAILDPSILAKGL